MKCLTTNELSFVSGGFQTQSTAEVLLEGAVIGGCVGMFINLVVDAANPISTIGSWALLGALSNAILQK